MPALALRGGHERRASSGQRVRAFYIPLKRPQPAGFAIILTAVIVFLGVLNGFAAFVRPHLYFGPAKRGLTQVIPQLYGTSRNSWTVES
jgi:hypothetical protein